MDGKKFTVIRKYKQVESQYDQDTRCNLCCFEATEDCGSLIIEGDKTPDSICAEDYHFEED